MYISNAQGRCVQTFSWNQTVPLWGSHADLLAGSRVSGFLQFLHLLSTHPWQEQALVVDPNAELSAANREAAVAAHSKVVETPPEVAYLCAYAATIACHSKSMNGSS